MMGGGLHISNICRILGEKTGYNTDIEETIKMSTTNIYGNSIIKCQVSYCLLIMNEVNFANVVFQMKCEVKLLRLHLIRMNGMEMK